MHVYPYPREIHLLVVWQEQINLLQHVFHGDPKPSEDQLALLTSARMVLCLSDRLKEI
jgi:hypothetical protein